MTPVATSLRPSGAVQFLPPDAPELNSSVGVWCNTTQHRLSNHGITTIGELIGTVSGELMAMCARPALMKSFIVGSALLMDSRSSDFICAGVNKHPLKSRDRLGV